jgi:hypothetical protein
MKKKFRLKIDRWNDYQYRGHDAFCEQCLLEFFEGKVTPNITLILSTVKIPNSYLVVCDGCVGVTLSSGSTVEKGLFRWLKDKIIKDFKGKAYLAIE